MNNIFRKFVTIVSKAAGSTWTFLVSFSFVGVWLMLGPHYHFSDSYQMIINTSTTIFTFLLGIIIQNTQERETKAIHLKLDELIRVQKEARNDFMKLESKSDEEISIIEKEFDDLKE